MSGSLRSSNITVYFHFRSRSKYLGLTPGVRPSLWWGLVTLIPELPIQFSVTLNLLSLDYTPV